MTKIGSWWLKSHEAQQEEKVLWSCLSNRKQSTNRAIGGKLFLTNKRLLFSPHLFDYILFGKKWSMELDQIATVDKQEKGGDIFSGGIKDRLRVTLKNGEIELFVVSNLDKVIEELKAAITRNQTS